MNPREEDSPSDASTFHIRALVPPTLEELNALISGYEFLEFVDHGGMGVVYKARQKSLNRIVAIKTLPPATHNRRTFADRFKREAEALAQLSHPHIVSVHDFGETANGILYFVMEFVKGSNLRRTMKERGLSSRQMLTIITQVCSALQYAHDHGIIHRDIKPGNILLDEEGNAKVADFGLAKVLGLPQGTDGLTAPLEPLGTPDYVAPEVLKGDKEVDHRADIFSLGVMLYEMSTGQLPKGAWEQPSRCGADARLDDVISRALQINPEDRFQQVNEFTQELQPLLIHSNQQPSDHGQSGSRTPIPFGRSPRQNSHHGNTDTVPIPGSSPDGARRSKRWKVLLALFALVLASDLGVALWQSPAARRWMGIKEKTTESPPQVSRHKTPEEMLRDQLALADWVFNHGGIVNIATPSQKEDHLSDEDAIHYYVSLPKEEFTILRVSFNDVESITDKDLAELLPLLAKAQSVSNLSLRGTRITALGLASLRLLKNTLTYLNIRHTSAFSAESLAAIAACDRLKMVFITITQSSSDPDNELVERLKALLPDCEIFSD